jgi:hypothetical protein
MYLTKVVVLIAHGDELNSDRICEIIDTAVGQQLVSGDRARVIYEIRPPDTTQVTLGAIDFALAEGELTPVAQTDRPLVGSSFVDSSPN